MKVHRKFITGIIIFLSTLSLSAEMQTGLTLINNVFAVHALSDEMFELSDSWMYGGDFNTHILVNPGMNFEEKFQADALLDVYFSKSYNTNEMNINVKQAYIDLFFFDRVGLKAGLIQTDYGFNNNYFHPMDVAEFVPEFRTLYPDIFVGVNNIGMPGVPSLRLYISLPEFIPGLLIGLDQGIVWFDYENFEKNYFLSSLSVIYSVFQAGLVLGYNGDSFSGESDVRKPVLGMNMSIGLPFRTMFLWEGVLRQESYRAYVEDNAVITYRENPFFNQSVRLETNQEEPFFDNTITAYAEYFYYGEGLSGDQYDSVYDYLASQGVNVLNIPDFYNLIINERNFKNYLTLGAGYIIQQQWSFLYKAIAELDSGLWQHWLNIGKVFSNVTIGGTFIYIPDNESKYQLIYGARNIFFYFQLSMEL